MTITVHSIDDIEIRCTIEEARELRDGLDARAYEVGRPNEKSSASVRQWRERYVRMAKEFRSILGLVRG